MNDDKSIAVVLNWFIVRCIDRKVVDSVPTGNLYPLNCVTAMSNSVYFQVIDKRDLRREQDQMQDSQLLSY